MMAKGATSGGRGLPVIDMKTWGGRRCIPTPRPRLLPAQPTWPAAATRSSIRTVSAEAKLYIRAGQMSDEQHARGGVRRSPSECGETRRPRRGPPGDWPATRSRQPVGGREGAVIVYDARTLMEVKRLPIEEARTGRAWRLEQRSRARGAPIIDSSAGHESAAVRSFIRLQPFSTREELNGADSLRRTDHAPA